MDYSVHGILSQNIGVGSLYLLQGIFQPRVQTQSPALQVDFLATEPVEPQRKPEFITCREQGVQFQFLVRELRSGISLSTAEE